MSGSAFEDLCAVTPPGQLTFVDYAENAARFVREGCTVRPVTEAERKSYVDYLQQMAAALKGRSKD